MGHLAIKVFKGRRGEHGSLMMEVHHAKKAKEALKEFEEFMAGEGWATKEDRLWPFHILVPTGEEGKNISVYCGGFSEVLEVHPLRKNGSPDRRYRERAFNNPRHAYEYLRRNWHLELR